MKNLLDYRPEEIDLFCHQEGLPAFRAKQITEWMSKRVHSLNDMSNLPKALRAKLGESFSLDYPREIARQRSADGTEKILWEFADGERAESVLMQYSSETSVCISTQAGCKMGCAFCASTGLGFRRNLTAGEMLGQVMWCGANISRVVLMGVGEPLDNFDETVKFLQLLSHPRGRNLSLRHVSLSTAGLCPAIDKLAEFRFPLTLSVSLHAPDDETRDQIMPINRRYNIDELMFTCRKYFDTTGRRISYEYLLLRGVNDSNAQARLLSERLAGHPAHVNLIPYNPVDGRDFAPSSPERVKRFADQIKGAEVTVRRRLGADINAACGQLRRNAE